MGELGTGSIIGGRYRIDSHLATGGMGSVYATTDVRTDRRYAVKVLHAKFAKMSALVERFKREALLLDSVAHPAVVNIHDCGETDDGCVFIALELLQGETLQQLMDREGPLEARALVPILRAVCNALAAIHAHGLVHRDVKPSNIFLVEAAGGPVIKLIDFGIAKATSLERLTSLGQVLGTPNYMAPEQLAGDLHADERTDVYAVGVVIYRALAGRSPWTGDRLRAITAILANDARPLSGLRPDLPASVVHEVMRAMSLAPRDRHPNAIALADAFEHAVATTGDMTVPTGSALPAGAAQPTQAPVLEAVSSPSRQRLPIRTAPSFAAEPAPDGARFSCPGTAAQVSTPAPRAPRRSRAGLVWLLGCAGLLVLGLAVLAVVALVAWNGTRAEVASAHGAASPDRSRTPLPLPPATAPATSPTAPPSVPAPSSATVRLDTVPSGALVSRGEERIGRTPVEVPRPAAPEGYELTLTRRAHVTERVRILPLSGDVVTVDLRSVERSHTRMEPASSRPIVDPWAEEGGAQ